MKINPLWPILLAVTVADATTFLQNIHRGIFRQAGTMQSSSDLQSLQINNVQLYRVADDIIDALESFDVMQPNQVYNHDGFTCVINHFPRQIRGFLRRTRTIVTNQQICTDQNLPDGIKYNDWLNTARRVKQKTQNWPQPLVVSLLYTDSQGKTETLTLDQPPYRQIWPQYNSQLEIMAVQGNNQVRFIIPADHFDWQNYIALMMFHVVENIHVQKNPGPIGQLVDCQSVPTASMNPTPMICTIRNQMIQGHSVDGINGIAQNIYTYALDQKKFPTMSFYLDTPANVDPQDSVIFKADQTHTAKLRKLFSNEATLYLRVSFQRTVYFRFDHVHS